MLPLFGLNLMPQLLEWKKLEIAPGPVSYTHNKGELRYRLKYLLQESEKNLLLKRIIDNREQNLEIYPAHKLDTYSGDED
jgi:hypothetical protein